jgi:hypothetical protein
VLVLLVACAAPAAADTSAVPWPPFLGPRLAYPPDVVAAVERIWIEPTLTRTVGGRPAHVPFELYNAFVDAPDVTAAAARFRKLARYEVDALDDDWYRATDNDGSHGMYRVIVREPVRRVVLSWGEHSGRILGTISGSALTVVELRPNGNGIEQVVTARVRIDQPVAAALARLLITVFGRLADRKLAEGFAVTARVAEWAFEQPREFCEWITHEPLPAARRERMLAVVPGCAARAGAPQAATSY